MKPAPFEYVRPDSIAEVLDHLASAEGAAKILAGGQSLIPLLSLRLARPEMLVDVNRIPNLSTIRASNGAVRVGALVRHSQLVSQDQHPLLAAAARWIGHAAIRTRGTVGGSLAHADPAAELPVVAVTLDATVHIAGRSAERSSPASQFFIGSLETNLADDEMITAVDFPWPARWGFAELARRHGDFGVVTVAAAEVAGRWRVAVGGVGPTPLRCPAAEHLLDQGARLSEVAAAAAAAVEPSSDVHGSGEYKRAMTEVLTARALAGQGLA
ncbi:MAG: xanthine dehydrogenase family protein subunit M [Acidimicrobiales bacterium]|nr:xanthine dehydrogenase family protein subunit M [Acidimicrobiales bacterium]